MPRKDVSPVSPSPCAPPSDKTCCFCGLGDDNELEYGKFHEYNGIMTHYYCLLLSSNMQQKGRDDEGILGFLSDDINKELKRGKRLACCYCKKTGATLGCCNTKCKKIFHFPCGLKSGSLHQFFGEFRSYCKNHRPKQKIDDRVSEEVKKRDDMICYICYDEVSPHDMNGTLWAPCCKKNAWFHRICVQQLAMSAGYFFKCPLCNNKNEFQKAMLDHGIFIPSQDASWELVPNAFEELLYRHNRCDADNCLCPKGREHTSTNAKWELTLCRTCGSQGIHMACGQLKWVKPIWECSECISILNKSVTSDSESSSIVRVTRERRRLRGGKHLLIRDDTSESDISVGTEVTEATTSESSSVKTREDERPKSPEEPVAWRITRRSVIPIPKSPVNTKIQTPKASTTNENLPPEPKRPRFSDFIGQRNRRESIDSDDDIIVLSGPSRSENSTSNGRKSSVERLATNNFWPGNTNGQIEIPTLKKEPQEPKKSEMLSFGLFELLKKPQADFTSRLSTDTEMKVVEIDLSESECTIPETLPTNSVANEIPSASSVPSPPELNIIITNVTSLAPEAFENVQEQNVDVKNVLTNLPPCTSMFMESNGGLTPQTPIIIDDEPLPVTANNPAAENNNLHYPSIGLHDQFKIVRFDGLPDASGNPGNNVLYGITIVGTNQTLPLIFTTGDNSNTNAPVIINNDVNKPNVSPNDCNDGNGNRPNMPANLPASPNTTMKPENRPAASTTTSIRNVDAPITPQPKASSLSLSVPLKAIVNERFSTTRTVRKVNEKPFSKTVTINSQGSLIKIPVTPIVPKHPVAQSPPITPNGAFGKTPVVTPILPKRSVVVQKYTPTSSGISSSTTLKKLASKSQVKNSMPNGIDATSISKMFALLPSEPFPASQSNSPVPNGIISSTTPKTTESVHKQNKPITTNVNSTLPNVNTTWLNAFTKMGAETTSPGVKTANLSSSTQLQIQKSVDNKQQIMEPQLYQLIRTDQNNAPSDDCDGDAGSGPAVQPASVINPANAKSSYTRFDSENSCQRVTALEGGNRSTHEKTSGSESDAGTDGTTNRSTSSDRSYPSNRTGLIYKSINLRDLKFSVNGSNIVKMTLYDTYSVNIKLDSSNSYKNTKYSSSRKTTKCSLGRKAKARNIERCDSKVVSNSLDSVSSVIDSENDAVLNQSESTSQENVLTPESINETNDLPTIDVTSRGQDELKENLDPIPPSTNSNNNPTNAVDRKSKLRPRSGVNHSIRSLSEKESQQMICDKNESPKKMAPHESQSVQNHSKVLYNGWKDTASHEESNAQNAVLDRSDESVAKHSMPCSFVNDNDTADDSDQIHNSKRKRISANDENLGEMQSFSKLTTTKEPNDYNYTNVNHLVNGVGNSKRKWSSCDDVSPSKKFHVNSIINGRKENASVEPLSCKVSIDLTKIRAVLTSKLNIFEKIGKRTWSVSPVANRSNAKDAIVSKPVAALYKSHSFDNLTLDADKDSIPVLRKSKSLEDLSSSSSSFCVDNSVENTKRGCKRKTQSFEKQDCVR